MSTIVRLPDGSRVSVPTDDPKQAAAAAQRHWKRRQPAPKPRTGWQTAGDFLGDVVDNVVPNFGDELAAIPDAAKAAVQGKPIREAFDRGRREFREHQAQYDKEHPYLAWGSTLTGVGASLALPGGAAVRGASMGSKMLAGAKVGAAYGALSGVGEGDSLSDRATNALKSAAIGGAFGAGATPVLAGAARAGRFVERTVPGVAQATRALRNVPRAVMRRPLRTAREDARDRADAMLSAGMRQGNISAGFGRNGPAATPASIAAEVERRQASLTPALAGDVTPQLRGMTAWASRGEGPGQRMVRERLTERKAEEANRLRQHVVETLGPVGDPYRQMEAHTARARREAAPMYAEAYAQPMIITPDIAGIMQTPAFRDAVPHAVRNIRNAQRDPDALGFVMGNDGQILPDTYRSLSTEGFDHVIRAMRDQGRAAAEKNPLTGQIINNANSVHINARAADLRDQLAAQNGAYRDVTAMYADELGQRDALQAGLKFGDRTGHEVNAWARQNPASAHPSYAIGARDFLADEASRVGAATPNANGAASLRKVLGDRTKQDALGDIMGDRSAIPSLQDRLEAEHQAHMLWADVEGNSKTAMRQASEDSFNAQAGVPKGAWSLRGLLSNAVNDISAGVGEQTRRDVKERVAEFTTAPNPEVLRGLMAEIAAKEGRDLDAAAAVHRLGVLGTKAYGLNIVPAHPSIYSDQSQYDPRYYDNGADDFAFNPGF